MDNFDMRRTAVCFAFLLLVTVTAGYGTRTCVEVHDTLMACILSSDMGALGGVEQEDLDTGTLCWHTSVLLECVAEAKDACPHLAIFSEPQFARAVQDMKTQKETHCPAGVSPPSPQEQTTSPSMSNDQAESCDPLAAMIECNDIMAGVTPGDVKAMCIPGEDYLACLTQVVENCPSHADALLFDLQTAIAGTRAMLQQECPAVLEEHACAEQIESAKRRCADFLSNGNNDYCRSLKTYMECVNITLMTCPDPDLQSVLSNQYQHHCGLALGKSRSHGDSSKCPDDIQSAMMECNSYVEGVNPNDRAPFCRKSKKYVGCVDALHQRCENNTRFRMFPTEPLDRMRQQIKAICSATDKARRSQARARTRYRLRDFPRSLSFLL